jgi:hypothetical protein
MNPEQSKHSRREMVTAGAGILAAPMLMAIGSPGAAGAAENVHPGNGGISTAPPMQNPLTEYPKPPFKPQRQEPPGLACKMEPPPDNSSLKTNRVQPVRGSPCRRWSTIAAGRVDR